MDIIIVGGGLFGCLAADILERDGHYVTVLDNDGPAAGSKPAACLMKPSWMTGLNPDEVSQAMDYLDRTYGLQTIKFNFNIGKVDVHWVPPRSILTREKLVRTVRSVEPGLVTLDNGQVLEADKIIVAAGCWTDRLVKLPVPIRPLAGVAYTFQGVKPPKISVWAPYKQLVMFEREMGTTWVGDGSAVLSKNWNKSREDCILNRCQKAMETRDEPIKREFGLRPYMDGFKGGFLKEVADGVWANTGGAKNGTIIGTIHALRLSAALPA